MFTGLVEEKGSIVSIEHGSSSTKIQISCSKVLENIKIGDSICTNGICLTAFSFDNDSFYAFVMGETMRKTNLSSLQIEHEVNLERALRVGDRLGGHIVTGHVDGTGLIGDIVEEDNAIWISIQAGRNITKYIIYKGSITIDGISLTVASVEEDMFKVCIIPHTQDETTLINKRVGDVVNLECDIVGKYIEKFSMRNTSDNREDANEKSSIDMELLRENGFL